MRHLFAVGLVLCLAPCASAQMPEIINFGLRFDIDNYSQATPKKAFSALIRAIERERFDYMVAHLLEPNYVDEQLRITYPIFEKIAAEQVAKEGLEKKGYDKKAIRSRIRDLATQTNYENLVNRIKNKLIDDPEAVKEIRKLFNEGEYQDGVDVTSVKHKDIKDRQLFFRKVGDRWFVENKMQQE